jgi:hypothetical protein
MGDLKIAYRLVIDTIIFKPDVTALVNDLRHMDITVAAGESYEGLIFFEVEEGLGSQLIYLRASRNDKIARLDIK